MWFVRRQMRSRRAKGMSVPQFRVLVHLRRQPAVSLSAVAEFLGASLPTASRIVSGLVSKGYVIRKSCEEDRRQVSLELTTHGQAALEAAWLGTQGVLAKKFEPLTTDDQAVLTRAFELLNELFARKQSDYCAEVSQESGRDLETGSPT